MEERMGSSGHPKDTLCAPWRFGLYFNSVFCWIVTTTGDLMKMLGATFECGCWLFLFAACLHFCFLLTTQGKGTGRHSAELSLGTL